MIPQILDQLKADLVLANKILLAHGVVDAFGHASGRHPERADVFLMSRRIAPGLVTEEDILEFGTDGELLAGKGPAVYLERYIHSAIYAARPDVNSGIHSHSPGIVAFSISDQPLRPVCHTCGFLGSGAPVFESGSASATAPT